VYAAQFPSLPATNRLATLHDLLAQLHSDIAFDTQATSAAPSAADAFRGGRGISQDLAHVFIAAARTLGAPARYVAGYFRGEAALAENGSLNAGHAWAEAHVPDLGWVGFDPATGVCATDQHVRVAVGLDCLGAAPVRGAHYGGCQEDVAVKLSVSQASWQTQE
jgi:transglutaminase-like putative cysteine protease